MADPIYAAGQAVTVNARSATIVRRMPQEDEGLYYEIAYTDGLEVEGAPIIVASGQFSVVVVAAVPPAKGSSR